MRRMLVTTALVASALAGCSQAPVAKEAGIETGDQALGSSKSYAFDMSHTDLGEWSGFKFDYSDTVCAAIGNPTPCGQWASDSAPEISTKSDGGWSVHLTGDHSGDANNLVDSLNDTYGSGNIRWFDPNSFKSLQRAVCGNLFPTDSEGDHPQVGALTCILSSSSGTTNPWRMGGPIGDGSYGWVAENLGGEGHIIWEGTDVQVAFGSDSSVNLVAGSAQSRQNDFSLQVNEGNGSPKITDVSYVEASHDVTSGQPYSPATSSYQTPVLDIEINAGRKGSSGPAQWFLDETQQTVIPTATNSDSTPGSLNFASCGMLTVTFDDGTETSDPFCVGQGHVENPTAYLEVGEAGNNWWAGGSGWSMDYCMTNPSESLAISPARGVGESTTRNQTLYIMPNGNQGSWRNPDNKNLTEPLCTGA